MVQRLNIASKKVTKRSKVTLLTVLILIIFSSFFLKAVFHQQKIRYAKQTLSLPKPISQTSKQNEDEDDDGWTRVRTQSGDTLANLFKQLGLNAQTLHAVLQNNKHAKALTSIKPNQELQFLIRDEQLETLIFPLSPTEIIVVSREGKKYTSTIKSRKTTSQNNYLTATVRGSLYTTAKRQNIPYKLLRQMTDIFNWEIDFIKDIRAGDQFSIVYEAYYIDDKLVNTGDILAVTYTNHGEQHQAIRHVTATGDYDYFSSKGTSLRKAFSRYPVKFSHISSSYSLSRMHPILHYRRPHKGVDLAAAIGTPVHATGDGRIEVIERHSGYGNMIKISHNNIYSSLYAHLLRFQKGLSRGSYVKRGQVIGYVGQTGLADGPHCHYEFHVKQQPKNPTTIELPRSSPVPKHEMASFKHKANTLLAQLKLYEDAQLIASKKTITKKG